LIVIASIQLIEFNEFICFCLRPGSKKHQSRSFLIFGEAKPVPVVFGKVIQSLSVPLKIRVVAQKMVMLKSESNEILKIELINENELQM